MPRWCKTPPARNDRWNPIAPLLRKIALLNFLRQGGANFRVVARRICLAWNEVVIHDFIPCV